MTDYRNLPNEVQEKVKKWLMVYDKTFVVYENGQYNVSSGVCLKAHYSNDHKVIGEYTAKEIFTDTERIENYINVFYSYPIEYKGKRDYKLLKMLEVREWNENMTAYTTYTGKIIDGDYQITGKITIEV